MVEVTLYRYNAVIMPSGELPASTLIVVKALTGSPWGLFTIAATIPIALAMGIYMRVIRPGRVGEASVFGVVLLLASIVYGRTVAADPTV